MEKGVVETVMLEEEGGKEVREMSFADSLF